MKYSGIFPEAIPEIFSFYEAPTNACFSLIKYFYPSILSGNAQTFSFYEALKNWLVRRSPLQLPVSSYQSQKFFPEAMPEIFSSCGVSQKWLFFPRQIFPSILPL